jgi:hypothetical protein
MNISHLQFITIINRMSNEARLNTSYISLCFALILCWTQQKHKPSFTISRKILMAHSKIASKSTYHICIKDLVTSRSFDTNVFLFPIIIKCINAVYQFFDMKNKSISRYKTRYAIRKSLKPTCYRKD